MLNRWDVVNGFAELEAITHEMKVSKVSEMPQIQPTEDRILVRRIEEPSAIALTDKPKSIKGVVLAVGPGKWVPGTWWYGWHTRSESYGDVKFRIRDIGWYWIDGYREVPTVKPGQFIAFNSRWNDLRHAENKGSGADGKGQLERPLSYKLDDTVHLIREADIFGILPHEHVKVEYVSTAVEKEYFYKNRSIA